MTARVGDITGERELAAAIDGAKGFGALVDGIVPNKDPDRENIPHRWSYFVDDYRAKVFKPVGDGSAEAYVTDMGVMLQTFDETIAQQRLEKLKDKDRLQDIDRRLLQYLVKRRNPKTGQLDMAQTTMANDTGIGLSTIKAALKRLARWLGLRWVRRTVKSKHHGQTASMMG